MRSARIAFHRFDLFRRFQDIGDVHIRKMEQIAPCVDKGHGVLKVVRRGRTSCTGNSHARLLLVAAALPLGASLADRDRWFCGSAASGKLFSHVELADGKCYFTVSLAVKELTNAGVVTFGEQRCAAHDRSSIVCTACRACALSIGPLTNALHLSSRTLAPSCSVHATASRGCHRRNCRPSIDQWQAAIGTSTGASHPQVTRGARSSACAFAPGRRTAPRSNEPPAPCRYRRRRRRRRLPRSAMRRMACSNVCRRDASAPAPTLS